LASISVRLWLEPATSRSRGNTKEEQALWARLPVAREARKRKLREEATAGANRIFDCIGEESPEPEDFKKVYMSLLESLTVAYHEWKASCPSTPNPSHAHEPTSAPENLSKPSFREGTSNPSQTRGMPTKGFVDHANLIRKDEPLQLRRNNTSCSNQPENSYDTSGTNLESEHQVGVPLLENLQMFSKPFKNSLPVSTNDICWETCPTKATSLLVTHQSVDEPQGLALENESQQEPLRSCLKSSTSVEDNVCQEKLLTAKTAVLSIDRNFDPECTCIHDEYNDLVIKQDEPEDDVLDVIYEGKRSRPPDVVDNDRTKSNVDSCTSPSASQMPPEALVADEVKAPQELQDGKCILVPERQDPVDMPEDDNVIDIVPQEKLDLPPNLEPRNTDRGSRASEMPTHLEAWAITDTIDLAIEQGFNGQGYIIWHGKHSQPPDRIQEIQPGDEHSHHLKLHASEWAPNDRYRSTAPPTSHEELEELSPSRILEYLENVTQEACRKYLTRTECPWLRTQHALLWSEAKGAGMMGNLKQIYNCQGMTIPQQSLTVIQNYLKVFSKM
jgi:hypothetical protein